jgi:histidyl-tRNA synthetase
VKFQAPRGTQDFLPDDTPAWQALEERARRLSVRHGYREIRTPMFESTDLFLRGVGETTDIVTKEMYTFEDRKGRSLTLRPEGTASVARALVEHGLVAPGRVHRLWYLGPMFRYDRPQAGRFRQFHQWGAEIVGTPNPAADVEIVLLLVDYLASFGLGRTAVKLNSVGHPGCRPAYQERLRDYLRPHLDTLCADCRVRFEKNPLRILDCKVPHDVRVAEGIPSMLDSLCDDCRVHFDAVQAGLKDQGVPFALDPRLVRGLDYYTRTAFEVHDLDRGAQSALGGGGRYDGLIEDVGGPPTPAVGFSAGLERILSAIEEQKLTIAEPGPLLFVARAGAAMDGGEAGDVVADRATWTLVRDLRRDFATVTDYESGRSLGAQLKQADRLGARLALILGEDELAQGDVTVKDLRSGVQERVTRDALREYLARQLDPESAR